jgi:hypothetical protein
MRQYLLSIYQPDETPDPAALAAIMRDVEALNDEMRAAGAWVFGNGLHPPATATVLRATDDRTTDDRTTGDVLVTDGPFIEAREFLGGFTVVRAEDLDGALHWGRRLARVLAPLAIEVRPFQ